MAKGKHSATLQSEIGKSVIGKSIHWKRRLLRSAFLAFVLLVVSVPVHAQRDTSAFEKGPVRWLLIEKSFGLLTETDFANGTFGLNITRGKFIRGTKRSMAGMHYYAGYCYDTDHQLSYATFGASVGYFQHKFGAQFGLKGLYYVRPRQQVLAVRPEIGIGFPKAHLVYGYNLLTEKPEYTIPRHCVTLYVYFALHSSRTRMF